MCNFSQIYFKVLNNVVFTTSDSTNAAKLNWLKTNSPLNVSTLTKYRNSLCSKALSD